MTAADLAEKITTWLADGESAFSILARIDNEFGAHWNPEGSTESLSFDGVRVSCTAGGERLLRNWCAAVERRNQADRRARA